MTFTFLLITKILIAVAVLFCDMANKQTYSKPVSGLDRGPRNARESMETTDMDPDDARQFVKDMMMGIRQRMNELPKEEFDPDTSVHGWNERAKQYYGRDEYLLLSGIEAALREWDASGRSTEDLKDEYGGTFVRGVEIGERLAVHQGSDFNFVEGSGSEKSKFTFVQ